MKLIKNNICLFIIIFSIVAFITGVIYYYSNLSSIVFNTNLSNSFLITLFSSLKLIIILLASFLIISYPLIIIYYFYEIMALGFGISYFFNMYGFSHLPNGILYYVLTKLPFYLTFIIFIIFGFKIIKNEIRYFKTKNISNINNILLIIKKSLIVLVIFFIISLLFLTVLKLIFSYIFNFISLV